MIRILTVITFMLMAAGVAAAERPEKPNVVLMYIDDLGWQDVKCYDIDEPSPYETPHIDALAKRGVLFWDAYSPAPTCSPSRGAILAGKHPARLQRTHVVGGQPPVARHETRNRMIDPWHMGRLGVEETTIAEVLKANGYRTGHSGKWHIAIGHHAFPQPPDHGFDVTFTGRGANSRMKPDRLTGFATTDPADPYQLDEEGFPKDSVTFNAISFMEESKGEPFFLYYATWLVHYPIMTRSKALLEKYCEKLGVDFPTDPEGWPLDGQRNPYYCAMVEMVDHYCGQLIEYLEETDDPRWPGHKLIENTYIIFSSDNGGTRGGHGETFTDNTPLNGGKGSNMEGGVRVPLIMAGPGIVEGAQTKVLANGVDFYPTILSWTKVDKPEEVQLDGCDLSGLLTGNPSDPNLVKHASGEVRRSMMHHFPHGGGGRSSLRADGYKLIYNYDHVGASTVPELELYRLHDEQGARVDLEEAHNLAASMPDKAQAMKAQLIAQLDEMDASRPYLNPRTSEALPHKEKVCRPIKAEREGNTVSVIFEEQGAKVIKGYLFYLMNSEEEKEEWFRKKAALGDGRLSAELPEGATDYRFTLIDENNFLVSYPAIEKKPPAPKAKKAPKTKRKKVRPAGKARKGAAAAVRGGGQGTTVPQDRLAATWWGPRHEEKVAQAKGGDINWVMIGDSITQSWEKQRAFADQFSEYKTLNLGFGGDRTENVLWRLQNGEVDGISPKLVTIMIGTNNTRKDTAEDIYAGIEAVVGELRERLPEAKIAVLSIFPRKPGEKNDIVSAVNTMLPKLADGKQVVHVDINQTFLDENGEQRAELYHRDMLHLSNKGYEAWFNALQPVLAEAGLRALPAAPGAAKKRLAGTLALQSKSSVERNGGRASSRAAKDVRVAQPQQPVIRLWPIEMVGGETNRLKEEYKQFSGRRKLAGIKDPNLTVYKADRPAPTPAVVYCPGGAYKILHPQPELIEWLNAQGITVFMLKYTIPDDRDAAFRDVQRAMRLVRHQAVKWNVDPDNIGVVGQSAGGHLSARLSQNYKQAAYDPIDEADQESCEPDFAILISAAYLEGKDGEAGLAPEFHLNNKVAPTFLVIAKDDERFIQGAVNYEKALLAKGASIRFQLYEKGGHGLKGIDWYPVCETWLAEQNIVRALVSL